MASDRSSHKLNIMGRRVATAIERDLGSGSSLKKKTDELVGDASLVNR